MPKDLERTPGNLDKANLSRAGENVNIESKDHLRFAVEAIYREILGREPDENGLQYWVSMAAAEKSLTPVREGILNSAELRALQYSIEPHTTFNGYVESELSILR